MTETQKPDQAESDFAREAERKPPSLAGELIALIIEYRVWWMMPIIVVLGLVGILVLLGATGLSPFIYPLF